MAAHAKRIEIVAEDRPVLEKWAGARAVERRLVDRARIVLLADEGRPASEIAQRVVQLRRPGGQRFDVSH